MKSQPLWSSTPAWRLPICKAPSPTSARRLSIYKAPTPRHVRGSSSFPHGAPCVHQLPRWQFPHQVAFPKKRGFPSSRLSRCPTTRAARPVRHNAGGVFLRHPPASSPSCSPSNRPGSCPGSFDKSRTCTHQTTQHDETSRARRQDLQTAPCASTARRRHRLARTAAIRAVFPTSRNGRELDVSRTELDFYGGYIPVSCRFHS